MKTEGRVMAVDAVGNFPSVLRPQILEHEVRALRCREIGEPVNSTVARESSSPRSHGTHGPFRRTRPAWPVWL
jgi:hypothetical protein